MDVWEATLLQIHEKYSVPNEESEDVSKVKTAITEVLSEIRNESRPSGLIPLLEHAEKRVQVGSWSRKNGSQYVVIRLGLQAILKDQAAVTSNLKAHIDELQGLVRTTGSQLVKLKV